MTNAIELTNVTRAFGIGDSRTLAVDRLTFVVPQGSVFGLLGANGAGKTTAIRMMVSHLLPDSGNVQILGENPALQREELRRRVAYISENMQIPNWMTLADAAAFCEKMYPNWNHKLVDHLEKRFRLEGKKQYNEYSKGQRRAVCLILGLAQNADVLILDEPASGLDTLARHDFLEEILNVACEENRTVLFSSHILGDIERIVDRVAILTHGRMVIEGELDSLKENVRRIRRRRPKNNGNSASEQSESMERIFQILQSRQSENETEFVTEWIVADFSEEKLAAWRLSLPANDQTALEIEGLNLEELFVETVK
ncbi:MAG: ABC transporter ATP-binding protein [Planctomycetaceae bacterium]|jgi:ABC-2 type transport system ATP-binding protein|nr:ABC transporter ATP-binding protein [Planctomycetaceae bacterium]